jgi:hypothetical protein
MPRKKRSKPPPPHPLPPPLLGVLRAGENVDGTMYELRLRFGVIVDTTVAVQKALEAGDLETFHKLMDDLIWRVEAFDRYRLRAQERVMTGDDILKAYREKDFLLRACLDIR